MDTENSKGLNNNNFGAVAAVDLIFPRNGLKRAVLTLFWVQGGPGPIQKCQFCRQAKTADKNVSDPIRLLKHHVRREKGPLGGHSVAGLGAPVTARHLLSNGKKSSLGVFLGTSAKFYVLMTIAPMAILEVKIATI